LKKQCVEGCTPRFLTLGTYEESEVKQLDFQQYSGVVRTASEDK